MLVRLRDGHSAVIRPIRPDDKRLLVDGLAHLSPESVRLRFMAPKPRFTAAELRYLTEVDGHDHVALVAVPVDGSSRLLGVGRFIRLREDPRAAEFAIVVADDFQRRGLGHELAVRLADEARARGIRRFTATILSENAAIRRLVQTISDRLELQRHGSVQELSAELAA